jgi:hypothetical protein
LHWATAGVQFELHPLTVAKDLLWSFLRAASRNNQSPVWLDRVFGFRSRVQGVFRSMNRDRAIGENLFLAGFFANHIGGIFYQPQIVFSSAGESSPQLCQKAGAGGMAFLINSIVVARTT